LTTDDATCRLYLSQLTRVFRLIRVPQHGDDGGLWNQFVQQPQLLRYQICNGENHAGHVAARPAEAGDHTHSDRIGAGNEDDRNRPGRHLDRHHGIAVRDDYPCLANDKIGRQPWQPIAPIVRPAILDRDVLTLDEASLVQALPAGSDFSCPYIISYGSSPSRCGPATAEPLRSDTRPPSFRCDPFAGDVALDPGRATAPDFHRQDRTSFAWRT
jgi:hypothetical protein